MRRSGVSWRVVGAVAPHLAIVGALLAFCASMVLGSEPPANMLLPLLALPLRYPFFLYPLSTAFALLFCLHNNSRKGVWLTQVVMLFVAASFAYRTWTNAEGIAVLFTGAVLLAIAQSAAWATCLCALTTCWLGSRRSQIDSVRELERLRTNVGPRRDGNRKIR